MYMSKDTIIINNLPVCDKRNLMDTEIDVFDKIFNARVPPEDLKAVHFWENQ